MIDEIANLTAYLTDRKAKERINQALGLLLTQGRAVGVCVVAALQDPRREVLALRNLFPDEGRTAAGWADRGRHGPRRRRPRAGRRCDRIPAVDAGRRLCPHRRRPRTHPGPRRLRHRRRHRRRWSSTTRHPARSWTASSSSKPRRATSTPEVIALPTDREGPPAGG